MSASISKLWKELNHESHSSYLLITPSWLSGVIAVIGAIAVVVATIVATQFPGSSYWEILQTQSVAEPTVSRNYETVNNNLEVNSFVSSMPLFIFWAGVGVMVYAFAANIFNIFQKAAIFKEEMEFVNMNRRQLIYEALLKLGLRVLFFVIWLIFVQLTLKIFIPYGVAATQYASQIDSSFTGLVYLLLALAIVAVTLHIHAVLLRLIRLRPRLFGELD